jgi:general secretion pathway protein K
MSARDFDRKSGMALVVVLWTIALVSALAMAASTSFRGFAGVMGLSQDRIKADALLSAGVEAAASMLRDLGDEKPLFETRAVIRLSTGFAEIHLSDEGGKIDLNRAPVKVLASLFKSLGSDDANANAIAQSIDGWRMRDQANQPPAPSPPAAALSSIPGQAPPAATAGAASASDSKPVQAASFTDVDQLAQIPGVANDLIAAAAPMVTVFGDDKVNALTAPVDVLAALPGVGRTKAEAFLNARLRSPLNEGQLQSLLGAGADAVELQSRPVASVEVTARLIDGFGEAAHATIVILPHDQMSYRVLAWTPLAAPARQNDFADGEGTQR